MNIEAIKKIVNSPFMADQQIRAEIFNLLAKDEDIIIDLLTILETERRLKKELLTDMNLQLSKAHIYINSTEESKDEKKRSFNKTFIVGEILSFYIKYKDSVKHCFK